VSVGRGVAGPHARYPRPAPFGHWQAAKRRLTWGGVAARAGAARVKVGGGAGGRAPACAPQGDKKRGLVIGSLGRRQSHVRHPLEDRFVHSQVIAAPPEQQAPRPRAAQTPADGVVCSLDTTGTSCTKPGEPPRELPKGGREGAGLHPDPQWAYSFREAVAEVLQPLWPTRAAAIRACGRAAIHLACGSCGGEQYAPVRCTGRTCPTCAHIASALIVKRVAGRLQFAVKALQAEPWDGPGPVRIRGLKHLTLTLPAPSDLADRFDPARLAGSVHRVLRAFPRFWRRTVWGRQVRDGQSRKKRARRDTFYLRAMEVSPNGVVHLHVVVFGEYISQDDLQRLWGDVVGEKLAIVHIRAVRDDDPSRIEGALREVLKYATKGHGEKHEQAQRAAAVEYAFRDVHRISKGGALLKIRPGELAFEDVGPDELAMVKVGSGSEGDEIAAAECPACGAPGPWRFIGFVSEHIVVSNGGFGPVQQKHGPAPPPFTQQSFQPAKPPVESAIVALRRDLPMMPSRAFAELRERANRWLHQQGVQVAEGSEPVTKGSGDD